MLINVSVHLVCHPIPRALCPLYHPAHTYGDTQGGWTALHRASKYQRKEVVELLLDRGADLEAKTEVSEAAGCGKEWLDSTKR